MSVPGTARGAGNAPNASPAARAEEVVPRRARAEETLPIHPLAPGLPVCVHDGSIGRPPSMHFPPNNASSDGSSSTVAFPASVRRSTGRTKRPGVPASQRFPPRSSSPSASVCSPDSMPQIGGTAPRPPKQGSPKSTSATCARSSSPQSRPPGTKRHAPLPIDSASDSPSACNASTRPGWLRSHMCWAKVAWCALCGSAPTHRRPERPCPGTSSTASPRPQPPA